jgi:hypothetical protein
MSATQKYTSIYVSITPDGLSWPSREDCENSLTFARIPGRWLSDIEFETIDGEVMLVPPTSSDGWRYGAIERRESVAVRIQPR